MSLVVKALHIRKAVLFIHGRRVMIYNGKMCERNLQFALRYGLFKRNFSMLMCIAFIISCRTGRLLEFCFCTRDCKRIII